MIEYDGETVQTSSVVQDAEPIGETVQDFTIILAPNTGQIINVASITSFLGLSVSSFEDWGAGPGIHPYDFNLTFLNQNFYNAEDFPGPNIVSFENLTASYYPNNSGTSTFGSDNMIPVAKVIKKVVFSNLGYYEYGVFAGANEADNRVEMKIYWAADVKLYDVFNPILLPTNYDGNCYLRIPTPEISNVTATPTLNHKYSLFIDEIDYIIAAGGDSASHTDGVTTHKLSYNPTGLTLTQTEQTNYDAYNHDGLGTSSVNATLTAITFEQLLAGTGGANPSGTSCWTGLRFDSDNHGKYYEVDIHGTYSSGEVATHKFKYTATQVDSTDTEFLMYNVFDTTTIRINDQDKLDQFMDTASVNDLTKGSHSTQLGDYKLSAVGTFSSGKCTAIEFTVSYQTSAVGSEIQTDTDYFNDPLIISPSFGNTGRLVLARRKII